MTDAWPTPAPARAFNTSRTGWDDLPNEVRGRIAELAGSPVANVVAAGQGFSPGFAGMVTLADGGRVFAKAVSERLHPFSIELGRREIEVAPWLPEGLRAPRQLWSHDDGDWVLAAWELIDGRAIGDPWTEDDLAAALASVTALAEHRPADGHGFEPFAAKFADLATMWRGLADLPAPERAVALGRSRAVCEWVLRHLDLLCEWESTGLDATAGDALVHADLRADNMVRARTGEVWIVDWPWSCVGAPWIDLCGLLPSVEMQGGGHAHELFAAHPLARGVDHDAVRGLVTMLAGYFVVTSSQPAPEQIPTLRDFQFAQAIPAIRWLQALEPRLA